MPLTLSQQVRLRIQDRVRLDEEIRVGDGTASGFRLKQGSPFSTLYTASAFVNNVGWSATGATIDLSLGTVKFSGVISANSAFRVEYLWSVFGEDEIGDFTAQGGDVLGASLQAVQTLIFDSLKRARWAAPDGTQYDDTAAQRQLQWMYSALKAEQREAPEGGIESWSEQQAYYSEEYNG